MADDVIERSGQACDSCRFWRQGPAGGRGPDWGECRRMPPTLPPIEEDKLLHVGVWPHTAGDDWCGEWQPAGGPESGGKNTE
jgi:hypothetical protein